MMSQREKFDGKLHYLDVKSNSDHPKLPDSSETNNIKRENFILYEEIFFKKPKPKPKTPIYYASNKFLFAKRLRKKSKIQNNDYFNSMSEDSKGYSLINLPRTFSDNETSLSPFGHLPQNKTFKQKKTNLLKGKIGKNYIDAYFPKIDNSGNLSANQKADLSLTGNSLTISSLSCNKNIKTIQKKLI